VDNGLIGATKTVGGHRRIPINEAVRFLRESNSALVRPEALGLSDLRSLDQPAISAEEEWELLFEHLRHGDAERARGFLLSLYLNGRSVAQIVDGPLQRAMDRLGTYWHHNEKGIFWEHRATEIALSAVSRLRMIIPSRPDDSPVAVGGAPAGDPYLLPTMCAAAVLESQGLNAVNLGADTPLPSLLLACQSIQARLVWLSVSVVASPETFQRELRNLIAALRSSAVSIIIGGSATGAMLLPDEPYLHLGSTMAELEAMVKGLRVAERSRS
jgi:methanogenic corrinoid protein MtbC1